MDLFKWGDPKKTFSIGSFIFGEPDGIISKVITWVKELFSWGAKKGKTAAGGFSMGKMIRGVIKSIKEFFYKGDGTGILEFDLSGALGDFKMPDFGKIAISLLKDFLPGKDSIFYRFLPGSLKEMLEEPDVKAAKGGPFSKGQSVLVGELGPEIIIPNSSGTVIPNNKIGGGDERLTKVLEALSGQLAAGAGASGGTNIDASSVNMSSAPTTTIGQSNAPRQRVAVSG
jgi:hypothetical protein